MKQNFYNVKNIRFHPGCGNYLCLEQVRLRKLLMPGASQVTDRQTRSAGCQKKRSPYPDCAKSTPKMRVEETPQKTTRHA